MMAYANEMMQQGEEMMKMAFDMRVAMMQSSFRKSTLMKSSMQSPRNVDANDVKIEREDMNIDLSCEDGPIGFDYDVPDSS